MLKADTIWNLESDSEPELDIQFQQPIDEEDSSDQSTSKHKEENDQTKEASQTITAETPIGKTRTHVQHKRTPIPIAIRTFTPI